jgi:hypothetical protein
MKGPQPAAKSIIDIARGQKLTATPRQKSRAKALRPSSQAARVGRRELSARRRKGEPPSRKRRQNLCNLWEMNVLVAMLEQWELANVKPEYNFVVRQYAIGKGHSVSILWGSGQHLRHNFARYDGSTDTVVIMIFGVTLFLNLARVLFNPSKVRFSCPDCGLQKHDRDAVHCKACGKLLNIPDEGAV